MGRWRLDGNPDHDYQVARSNDEWPIHRLRTKITGGIIAWQAPRTVCDPACGDASLLEAAHALHPIERAYLGDISLANITNLQVSFPHERFTRDAMQTLLEIPHVDLILLTEFLEHVEDPDAYLRQAREKADMLVASSPLDEKGGNPEHLWGWDAGGYQQMLMDSGWRPESGTLLTLSGFTFQIYTAR